MIRATLKRLAYVAVCIAVLPGFALADEDIISWFDAQALANEAAPWMLKARSQGLGTTVGEIRAEVMELQVRAAPGTDDRAHIDTFLELMNEVRARDIDLAICLTPTLEEPPRTEATTVVNSIMTSSCEFAARNPFKAQLKQVSPGGVTVSDGRLDFLPNDTSEVSKQLVRYAFYLNAMLTAANLPRMQATADAIHAARTRWDEFMSNVVHDQFIWETLFNGWLAKSSGAFAGTLSQPPTAQLRIVHPAPVLLYSNEDGSQFQPRIGVEMLGYRRFNASRAYRPSWGISAMMLLPGSSTEEIGWGLSYTSKRLTIGVAWREIDGNDDVFTIVIGAKAADLFTNEATGLADEVDRRLDEILVGVEANLLP